MYARIYSKNQLLNQREEGIKVMEKIPSWMERLLLPKLKEITGEIKAIHTRIDAVGKEIVSLRNEMISRFETVDAKFEKVDARFDSFEAKIPATEQIAEFFDNRTQMNADNQDLK
jgi:uncharacterized coiled-coil DUF342 family protein